MFFLWEDHMWPGRTALGECGSGPRGRWGVGLQAAVLSLPSPTRTRGCMTPTQQSRAGAHPEAQGRLPGSQEGGIAG